MVDEPFSWRHQAVISPQRNPCQLPGHGGGHDGLDVLAGSQPAEAPAEAYLRSPRPFPRSRRALLLGPADPDPDIGTTLVGPGRLHELGPEVNVAGLGDVAPVGVAAARVTQSDLISPEELRAVAAAGAPLLSWGTSELHELTLLGEALAELDRVRFLSPRLHQELFSELRWTRDEALTTLDGLDIAAWNWMVLIWRLSRCCIRRRLWRSLPICAWVEGWAINAASPLPTQGRHWQSA